MIGLAAIAMAGAVWLIIDRRSWLINIRLDDEDFHWSAFVRSVVIFCAGFVGWHKGLIGFILAATFAVITTFTFRQWLRHKERLSYQKRSALSAEAFEALAADLHAGVPPAVALERLGEQIDFFAPAANAAALGGDVAYALGVNGLKELAAAWSVAEESGAPLAATLEHISHTTDELLEAKREVESSLAPAQATAKTMAILPLIAISIGSLIGYDPIRIVTTTLYGAVSFALGCGFAMTGVWWVDRLATRAGV